MPTHQTPISFLSAFLLIAIAALVLHTIDPATAAGRGSFLLMNHSNTTANVGVFRLDTESGDVSYCYMKNTNDLICTAAVH